MGYIFTVVTICLLRAVETIGLLWVIETMGLIRAVDTMGLLWAVSSMGLLRAYDRLAKHGPITDRIMAVNGLELESSVHGQTITGCR